MCHKLNRIIIFLLNMVNTIHNYANINIEKHKIYTINKLNEKLSTDVGLFISNIKNGKQKNDLEENISLLDIRRTDSLKDKLFEYRMFFVKISSSKEQMMYKNNIIDHLNNFLLLLI